jgi:hypothetical protein
VERRSHHLRRPRHCLCTIDTNDNGIADVILTAPGSNGATRKIRKFDPRTGPRRSNHGDKPRLLRRSFPGKLEESVPTDRGTRLCWRFWLPSVQIIVRGGIGDWVLWLPDEGYSLNSTIVYRSFKAALIFK